MAIIRMAAATLVGVGAAIVLASPASADERLAGDYTFTNGATTNTWTIETQCNPEATCAGTVSSSTGMLAQIRRVAGGPWIVERHDVPNGRVCPDGNTGPADLMYSFDAATLVGAASFTSKPGVCNDPNPSQGQNPISLQPA
jgi:hypothetical protein